MAWLLLWIVNGIPAWADHCSLNHAQELLNQQARELRLDDPDGVHRQQSQKISAALGEFFQKCDSLPPEALACFENLKKYTRARSKMSGPGHLLGYEKSDKDMMDEAERLQPGVGKVPNAMAKGITKDFLKKYSECEKRTSEPDCSDFKNLEVVGYRSSFCTSNGGEVVMVRDRSGEPNMTRWFINTEFAKNSDYIQMIAHIRKNKDGVAVDPMHLPATFRGSQAVNAPLACSNCHQGKGIPVDALPGSIFFGKKENLINWNRDLRGEHSKMDSGVRDGNKPMTAKSCLGCHEGRPTLKRLFAYEPELHSADRAHQRIANFDMSPRMPGHPVFDLRAAFEKADAASPHAKAELEKIYEKFKCDLSEPVVDQAVRLKNDILIALRNEHVIDETAYQKALTGLTVTAKEAREQYLQLYQSEIDFYDWIKGGSNSCVLNAKKQKPSGPSQPANEPHEQGVKK